MPPHAAQKLSHSLEDYLECIYRLCEAAGEARAKDVAERLGVHKSSVTGAFRALNQRGLVTYEPYASARMTAAGRKQGASIWRRHTALRNFLESVLDVEEEEAAKAACEMEHVVSREMTERLARFAHYLESRPEVVLDFRNLPGADGGPQPEDDRLLADPGKHKDD